MAKNKVKDNPPLEPGVILLQIDGLARFQMERAIHSRRMPFLAKLLRSKSYKLHSFYPGLPSCTPAVQAELHYGVQCATPAFSFYDSATKQNVRMYDAEWASRIAEESESQGAGLLENGSSYANIYTGGASKAKYCGELNTFAHWSKELSILRIGKLAVRHPMSAFRLAKLFAAEIGIGLYDAVRGIASRGEFLAELTFVPARLAVAIALREAIRGEVQSDIKTGLPVIHANFFGYDEAAHRRGPHSRFAHWTLKGIDGTIRTICKHARKSKNRDYQIIIFSDHGQEHCVPYDESEGRSLADATEALLSQKDGYALSPSSSVAAFMERSKAALQEFDPHPLTEETSKIWVHLQAMGPVAHVYTDDGLSDEDKREWARQYASEAGIPYVLFELSSGGIECVTEEQEGDLEILRRELNHRSHEFTDLTITDLAALVRSKYAGHLVLLGWRSSGKPLTFAEERGAHAGPGAQECRGFAMLPTETPWSQPSMRPSELRGIVQRALGIVEQAQEMPEATGELPSKGAVRTLSYNVHGGVGTDRKLDCDRLAQVILESNADVICFQEAFESEDGPSLKKSLEVAWPESLHYHFLELHRKRGVRYGLAVASKRPFNLRQAKPFGLDDPRISRREPRGAIWIETTNTDGKSINVVNTHFGLRSLERTLQAQTLLKDDWLGSLDPNENVIVSGDFNAGPRGTAYLTFAGSLSDAQLTANHGVASPSFISWAPIRRIDHIFASPQLNIPAAGVLTSPRIRQASDHLPVFADIETR